jgi:hypothetical protein
MNGPFDEIVVGLPPLFSSTSVPARPVTVPPRKMA